MISLFFLLFSTYTEQSLKFNLISEIIGWSIHLKRKRKKEEGKKKTNSSLNIVDTYLLYAKVIVSLKCTIY